MISGISIKDFRSIASADLETSLITSFVGSNDAGKSNVLRALNLFFNGDVDHGEEFDFSQDYNRFAIQRVRKAEQVEITIRFLLPKSYQRSDSPKEIQWTKVWRYEGQVPRLERRSFVGGTAFPPRSKIPALLDRIVYSYIPATKDRDFFSDLQGKIYDVLSTVAQNPLQSSANEFEEQLQAQLQSLLESLSSSISPESRIRLPENLREIFESLEISSNEIPLSRRGDGIKIRHIPMMLAFIAHKHDEVMRKGGVRYTHIWGFEEPENNVEMSSAFKMAAELNDLVRKSENIQLFLTTHSPIFYRMDEVGGARLDSVTTYFVDKPGLHTEMQSRQPSEVDETLGLMPIVAPYVKAAQERFLEMQRTLSETKQLLERATPTVFVEGATDKRVLEICWSLFAPDQAGELQVHSGNGDYGGAGAVASRFLAWLLETKHKRPADRMGVAALFDNDAAGRDAHAKLRGEMSDLNLSSLKQRILFYPDSFRLAHLKRQGFNVPIDLEMLYPDEIWDHAERCGWLEERDNLVPLLGEGLVHQMVVQNKNPIDALDANDRRRIAHRFSDEGKQKAAAHIASKERQEQMRILDGFRRLVKSLEQVA